MKRTQGRCITLVNIRPVLEQQLNDILIAATIKEKRIGSAVLKQTGHGEQDEPRSGRLRVRKFGIDIYERKELRETY